MATVLMASLGDSPVVVTAMFDLVKEKTKIDRLEVFYPGESLALLGYEELIRKALQQKYKQQDFSVEGIPLDYEDVSGEDAVYDFLRKLYTQLAMHQKSGDVVYLSLAGGRKSMAALMALLAPLFPCVRELYHILDKDEGLTNFKKY
jgi:CRISPR-associated Csx14 family protein